MCVSMQQTQKFLEVIPIEVRINKEVRDYQESLFFGLSLRQFLFALLSVLVAVGLYFGLRRLGSPPNRQILWGEEEGMEWTPSPSAAAGRMGFSVREQVLQDCPLLGH